MSDDDHMGAPSNRELWQVLEAIVAQEGSEGLQNPESFSQERALSVVQELLRPQLG